MLDLGSVNLFLLEGDQRVGGARFVLRPDQARHAIAVLGVSLGREVAVGLVGGALGTGVVARLAGDRVELECTFGATSPRPPTDLVLAIPRPKTLAKVLPAVAALGVDRLVLLRTWKVDKSYLSSPLLEPTGARPLLIEGLEQGKHTHLPALRVAPRFVPFVEDELPALVDGRALVADPLAPRSLAELSIGPSERLAVAIGPEGGFTPYELDRLEAAGFWRGHLATPILRVEHAVVAALAQVALLRARGVASP